MVLFCDLHFHVMDNLIGYEMPYALWILSTWQKELGQKYMIIGYKCILNVKHYAF